MKPVNCRHCRLDPQSTLACKHGCRIGVRHDKVSCHCGLDPQSTQARLHAGLLVACLAISALAAGCAQTERQAFVEGGPGVLQPQVIAPPAAQSSIVIGKSTKADVQAALGEATKVPFDSGFEVWVYRWPGAQKTHRAATELIILFEPTGVVKKTRMRPGYAGPDGLRAAR